MSKSEDVDRERRRVKKRFNWARALLKPATFKALVALGQLIAQVLSLVLEIIKVERG